MKKRLFGLLLVLCLVSALGQLLLYPKLPETIPISWGMDGEVNGYGEKTSLLLMAALPLITLIGMWLLPKIDPRRENYEKHQKAYSIFSTAMVVGVVGINWSITLSGLGWELPVKSVVLVLLGLLFMVLGNYMPQLRSNFFIGFRTPWAIDNENVWRKTNRVAGVVFFISGLLLLITAFITGTGWIHFIGIGFLMLGCCGVLLYSYILYKISISK